MSLKTKAEQLNKDIPAVFLALKHKSTPIIAKIIAGITVAYALSPIDFIPDFIPVLGYLDDIIILPLLVALTVKLIPKNIMDECREKSDSLWENGKTKKWYYSLPIIFIWLLLLWLIIKIIFF